MNSKLNYSFIENKFVQVVDDHLFFKGLEYYQIKKKLIKIIIIFILNVLIIGKMNLIGLVQKDFVILSNI